MIKFTQIFTAFSALALFACTQGEQSQKPSDAETADRPTLTIYSARHYDSDQRLYDGFEALSGAKIEVREGKSDQLLEIMKAEGDQSPADLILAADAGALWRFKDAGLTRALSSADLADQIPAKFRDSENHWYGVSKRLRVIVYDPERFTPDALATWEGLVGPDKDGEICVRTASNIYNLSLMAELIQREGREAAERWAAGIASNMARRPQGGDTDQIRAVAAGQCGLAIVNHYYWVRLANSGSESDREAAASTRIVVPAFGDGGGAHVNISGAAISATTDAPDLAEDFIAYLLTAEGQALLTADTYELELTEQTVDGLPTFSASDIDLGVFGENQAEAQTVFDLAGWN
ncbi:MAG: extracellular solute-binding protein [Pseudomonadota bacterium]